MNALFAELSHIDELISHSRRSLYEVSMLAPTLAVDSARISPGSDQAFAAPATELLNTVQEIEVWCNLLQSYLAQALSWQPDWGALAPEERAERTQQLYERVRLLAARIPGPGAMSWLDVSSISDVAGALRRSVLRVCTLLQDLGKAD